jgi:hypothetical protein
VRLAARTKRRPAVSTPKPTPDPQAALAEIFRRLAERGRRIRAAAGTAKAGEAGQIDKLRPERAAGQDKPNA